MFFVLSEGGKFAEASPAVVLKRLPTANAEPVSKWGVIAVFLHVDEGRVSGADVVEDAIDDDAKALSFGFAKEIQENLVTLGPGPR